MSGTKRDVHKRVKKKDKEEIRAQRRKSYFIITRVCETNESRWNKKNGEG